MTNPITSAQQAAALATSTCRAERANIRSTKEPIQGSMTASSSRTAEEQRTQRGQRHAEIARIEVGQMHVERKRDERQRQAQEAIAPSAHHRVHDGVSPNRAARNSGCDVAGPSQMPKKLCENRASAISPANRSLK